MYVLYSVLLCCFVYCLCVSVYLQLPPGLNLIAVNKICQILKLSGGFMKKEHITVTCFTMFKLLRPLMP